MDKQAQQTILVDLDGTLAEYKGWNGHTHIGDPVPIMARRIRRWLNDGKLVKIFTARFAEKDPKKRQEIVDAIQRWTQKHFGRKLKVTNEKDKSVTKIWDDRAMSVTRNKGRQTKLDYHEKHAALDPEQEESLRYGGLAALGGLAGGAVAGPGGAALGVLASLAGLYGYRRMNPSEAAKAVDPLKEKLQQRFKLLRLQQGYTPRVMLPGYSAPIAPAVSGATAAAVTAQMTPGVQFTLGRASVPGTPLAKVSPARLSVARRLGQTVGAAQSTAGRSLVKAAPRAALRVGAGALRTAMGPAATGLTISHGFGFPESYENDMARMGWKSGTVHALTHLWNVPGMYGSMLKRTLSPDEWDRMLPSMSTGRSVKHPYRQYLKRLIPSLPSMNTLNEIAEPGVEGNPNDYAEEWAQLSQPAVTELPPRE